MHEIELAQHIVEIVKEALAYRPGARVKEIHIHLRIGELTHIVPETIQFAYESLTAETPLAASRLEIEMVPAKGRCLSCHSEFAIPDSRLICPQCGSTEIEILQGNEFTVEKVDLIE